MSPLVEPIVTPVFPFDLNAVVERLADLRRQAQRRRYPGATPQLPSKRSILAITEDCLGVVYPRHLSRRDLANDDLDLYVAQTLERLFPALAREVALELSLPDRTETSGDPTEIVAGFFDALPWIRQRVDVDIRAALAADPAQGSFDELVFCSVSVAAILRHRLAHELYRLGAPLTAKIIAADLRSRTGIDIHPGAEIGEGFSIANAAGLAIGETAVIGRNVRVHAPVTLGESFAIASDDENGAGNVIALSSARASESPGVRPRRHPRLEDDVVIEAGASLFGPIIVGRGSSIGRNAWVLRDVPPQSRVEASEV